MRILQQADPNVRMLLGAPKPASAGKTVLSVYVLSRSVGGQTAAANLLTRQLVLLDRSEEETLRRLRAGETVDAGDPFADWLRREGWLVPADRDETAFYLQLYSLLREILQPGPGFRTFTILPATACNARCVYCYEEGYRAVTMSRKTADEVTDFILTHRGRDSLKLAWFGGEPLAAHPIITHICERLAAEGVDFTSTTTTNGTLFTPEVADAAVSLWKLRSAIVSVDGCRADYLSRKRFPSDGIDYYERMMNGVGLLLERGVEVLVSCNCDPDNIDGVTAFAGELMQRFGAYDRLTMQIPALYSVRAGEQHLPFSRIQREKRKELQRMGVRFRETGFSPRLRFYRCKADLPESAVVIDPEGRLFACEHLACMPPWGDVRGGVTDPAQWAYHRGEKPLREKCRGCMFLPECTPFPDCPMPMHDCRDILSDGFAAAFEYTVSHAPSDREGAFDPC